MNRVSQRCAQLKFANYLNEQMVTFKFKSHVHSADGSTLWQSSTGTKALKSFASDFILSSNIYGLIKLRSHVLVPSHGGTMAIDLRPNKLVHVRNPGE